MFFVVGVFNYKPFNRQFASSGTSKCENQAQQYGNPRGQTAKLTTWDVVRSVGTFRPGHSESARFLLSIETLTGRRVYQVRPGPPSVGAVSLRDVVQQRRVRVDGGGPDLPTQGQRVLLPER